MEEEEEPELVVPSFELREHFDLLPKYVKLEHSLESTHSWKHS